MNRRSTILREAIISAAHIKCGWSGWRLCKWLGSMAVTDNGRYVRPWLSDVILSEFRKLASY